MVTIGSVDGWPLINGVGNSLMTTAAVVACEVTVPAAVMRAEVDPPTVTSSVLLLKTLSMREDNVLVGSALVIGASTCCSVGPIGVWLRTVLAASPTLATDAVPVATGFLPFTATLVCEQARPSARKAFS